MADAHALPGVPPPERLVEARHPLEARLHKWEARKDAGVVAAWIEASSRPGELVVDPFMGSGTAPLAAARLGRRAIGIDLSPLALELARVTADPPGEEELLAAFASVELRLRGPGARRLSLPGSPSLRELYAASCPACAAPAELAHAVWSVRIACSCGAITPAHELAPDPRAQAQGRGTSAGKRCPACGGKKSRGIGAYRGELLHRCFVRCEQHGLQEAAPTAADTGLAAALEAGREQADVWTPAGVALRYPAGAPLMQLRHSLRERPLLDELWTGRNFLATGLLAEAIDELPAGGARAALRLSLSAIVKATSRMPTVNTGGWRHKGTGLSSHLLGIFPLHLEQNAWEELSRHVRTRLIPGLRAARAAPAIRLVAAEPRAPGELSLRRRDAVAGLRELPAASVDFAFADPPYGDAVQYAELSLPHLAWLARPRAGAELAAHVAELLGDAAENEVVENTAQGKGRAQFELALGAVLGELRRVLRPERAAVLTFNSPDEGLIRAVTGAAEAAGLRAAGIHHQRAFKESHKGAWHQRTARGTLFLRFLR